MAMTWRPLYVPQASHAKCGRLVAWHCGHSTVVTVPSFQFAARRLRVLLRGVFHFGFAMSLLRVPHNIEEGPLSVGPPQTRPIVKPQGGLVKRVLGGIEPVR